MRTITVHSEYIYKTKSSAWRAARKAVGRAMHVDVPDLYARFDGKITIGTDMIDVAPCDGGWLWLYTYNLGDVDVLCRVGEKIVHARYADVAHWADYETPPATPESNPVHEFARRAAEFLYDRNKAETDAERRALSDRDMPELLALSRKTGVGLTEVMGVCRAVDEALVSGDPRYIAEVIVRAEPYGLASEALHAHLATRLRPAEYLRVIKEKLAQGAA